MLGHIYFGCTHVVLMNLPDIYLYEPVTLMEMDSSKNIYYTIYFVQSSYYILYVYFCNSIVVFFYCYFSI